MCFDRKSMTLSLSLVGTRARVLPPIPLRFPSCSLVAAQSNGFVYWKRLPFMSFSDQQLN